MSLPKGSHGVGACPPTHTQSRGTQKEAVSLSREACRHDFGDTVCHEGLGECEQSSGPEGEQVKVDIRIFDLANGSSRTQELPSV